MKKVLAILCMLCLLGACAAPACAEGIRDRLNDMLSLVLTEEKPAAGAAEVGDAPSLWGKRVTIEKTVIPDKAFAEKAEMCTAVSPTGKRLLISGGLEPCLWDTETQERIPLFLGDAESKAAIRSYLENLAAQGKIKLPEPLEDDQLFSAYIASAQPVRRQYAPRFVPDYPSNERTSWLRVADSGIGAVFLLDTETGALYFTENGTYVAVHDGVMLRQDLAGSGTVSLKNVKTGQISTVDFASQSGLAGRASVLAAQFLPDGSVCAVLRSGKLDPKKGEACAAVIWSPSGAIQRFSLGMIRLSQEPDRIFCAGADQIVLYSRSAIQRLRPYRIDRKQGTVSLLTVEGAQVLATPLKDCMDADGQITQPSGDSMMI